MRPRFIRFCLLMLALCFTASCTRRPLADKSEDVNISIDLDVNTIVNVTTEIYNELVVVPEVKPEMMCIMFFNPETKRLITQTFVSDIEERENGELVISGNIRIQPGVYDMLCYNFDTEAVQIRNEQSWNTIEAYTNEVTDRGGLQAQTQSRDEVEHINYEPDHLLVARQEGLRVDASSTKIVITTEAATVVKSYYVQVRLKNAQFASKAAAVITGMSASNKIGLNQLDESSSGIFFEMDPNTDPHVDAEGNKDVLCATFNTFGKLEGQKSELRINFTSADGEPMQFVWDMDSIFNTEMARQKNWLLIEDEIEVPIPDLPPTPEGDQGGGFSPEVNEWEEEKGEIII